MSPVSRGRRPKKSGKRAPQKKNRSDALRPSTGPPESALATLVRALGGGARPAWFDGAIERVLAGAGALTTARDARELDQRVAELVGAELYAALQSGFGLRFEWWFGELLDAAVERVEQGDDPGRQGVVWLLHGLAAQRGELPAALLRRTRKAVRNRPVGRLPGWLDGAPRIAATGEVRRLRDAYGTRFGVIAEYVAPGDARSSWYLFDIDASGFVVLADAGVYDDAEQAAEAWRITRGRRRRTGHDRGRSSRPALPRRARHRRRDVHPRRGAAPGDGQLVPGTRPHPPPGPDLAQPGTAAAGSLLALPRPRHHGARRAVHRLAHPHPRRSTGSRGGRGAGRGMDGGGVAGDLVLGLPGPHPLPARADRRLDPRPRDARGGRPAARLGARLGERAGLPADRMQPLLDAARETPARLVDERTL